MQCVLPFLVHLGDDGLALLLDQLRDGSIGFVCTEEREKKKREREREKERERKREKERKRKKESEEEGERGVCVCQIRETEM